MAWTSPPLEARWRLKLIYSTTTTEKNTFDLFLDCAFWINNSAIRWIGITWKMKFQMKIELVNAVRVFLQLNEHMFYWISFFASLQMRRNAWNAFFYIIQLNEQFKLTFQSTFNWMNVLFKCFSLIYRCGTLQTGSDCPEAGNRKDEERNGEQGRQTRSGYMVQILLCFYLYCLFVSNSS